MLLGSCPSEKSKSLVFVDPNMLGISDHVSKVVIELIILILTNNWDGYLLLVSDERSPLIHSWSATFDGTCFNLHGASL